MRRLLAGIAAASLIALGLVTPVSLARFTGAPSASASFATGTLAAPASLAAAANGGIVTLTWTPSTTSAVTGYDVLRSTTPGSGYAVVSTVTPRLATSTTDSPGNGRFHYVLQAVYHNWRSASSNEASVTIGSLSSGPRNCTGNAADTGGDNNGYETSPGNGCAVDGANAVDAGSGTSSTISCSDPGKDRHRYWGYDFFGGGSASIIEGITVTVVAGLNNNGGTSQLCVQLSGDGGASWTAAKSFPFTGAALATYTLGGATDTWGTRWTAANLAPGTFRVRLVDVTSQPNKDFRLDAVQVAVSYTP